MSTSKNNGSSFGVLSTARSQLSGAGGSGYITIGAGGNGFSYGKDKHWYHRELFRFLLKLRAVRPEHGIPGLAHQYGLFAGGAGGAGSTIAVASTGSSWVTERVVELVE